MLTSLPGLEHWSARSVLYVGRSDGGFTAVRLRPRWNAVAGKVYEAWRAPLDTADGDPAALILKSECLHPTGPACCDAFT
jgi:hypothetical protein